MMFQRTLFDLDPPERPTARRLDAESGAFLVRYREQHGRDRSGGAVRGEVSQLRSVVREAGRRGRGNTLSEVLARPAALAEVLTSPAQRPSATTALIRLGAIHAALLLMFGDDDGRRRFCQIAGRRHEPSEAFPPRRPRCGLPLRDQ